MRDLSSLSPQTRALMQQLVECLREGQTPPPPLSDEQLREIRARADAATVAPWAEVDGSWVIASSVPQGAARIASGEYGEDAWRFYGGELICESIGSADAAFVAAARTDVPKLLDMVDYLTDLYAQIVQRSADEADRAQALISEKDAEILRLREATLREGALR